MIRAALILALSLLGHAAARAEIAEPDEYRTGDYRSPTPTTLRGARVLTTDEAAAMWKDGKVVFVDVMPHPPRPPNLPPGTIWREKPRQNIPNSIWLPDTGYGALAPPMENYLRTNLDRIAGADRAKMLAFYCLRDCWMSWNAAKRALAMGYPNVAWFPEGTDGWEDALLPLAESKPEPRPE
jgi:PQQ-dependent catabolism-associated CXXCW motif protein